MLVDTKKVSVHFKKEYKNWMGWDVPIVKRNKVMLFGEPMSDLDNIIQIDSSGGHIDPHQAEIRLNDV